MLGIKRVEEFETVLLETENVQFLVVEINIELAVNAGETAMMQIVPHRLHDRCEADILEVVFYHHFQILVDREYRYRIQFRLYSVENGIAVMTVEGMLIEHIDILFMKFFDRNQQDRRIEIYAYLLVSPLQESTLLESLTQVGCHRNTTLYCIRFIDELMLSFTVNYRKAEGVSAHADGESCLLNVVTFYLHICYQLPALLLSVVKSPILSPG